MSRPEMINRAASILKQLFLNVNTDVLIVQYELLFQIFPDIWDVGMRDLAIWLNETESFANLDARVVNGEILVTKKNHSLNKFKVTQRDIDAAIYNLSQGRA